MSDDHNQPNHVPSPAQSDQPNQPNQSPPSIDALLVAGGPARWIEWQDGKGGWYAIVAHDALGILCSRDDGKGRITLFVPWASIKLIGDRLPPHQLDPHQRGRA